MKLFHQGFFVICVWNFIRFSTLLQASQEADIANFTCADGTTILASQFCDDVQDCDGSDENVTLSLDLNHDMNTIRCRSLFGNNRSCIIHRDYVCNGTVKCFEVDYCDIGCSNYYQCHNGRCIDRSSVCDGVSCNGCAEDDDWNEGVGFKCYKNKKICRLPQQLLWDGIQDCDGGEDLCYYSREKYNDNRDLRTQNEISFNYSRCFLCLDGTTIIPRQKVCDGIIDCPDLSDECLCEGRPLSICKEVVMRTSKLSKETSTQEICRVGQVRCGDGSCINRTSVCDAGGDCPDNMDERHCEGPINCKDAQIGDKGKKCRCGVKCPNNFGVFCDGIGQCPPFCGANSRWINKPGFPVDECSDHCINITKFNCTRSGCETSPENEEFGKCIVRITPASYNHTGPGFMKKIKVNSSSWCDGKIDCSFDENDENDCPNRYYCKAGSHVSIELTQVCDGSVDCNDGSDESRSNCPDRFFCPSLNGTKVSIAKDDVCDFTIHCDNSADELNCTDGRFYCSNGTVLFVKKNQVLDNRVDCSDFSDECPFQGAFKKEDVFSSRYHLISNPLLRAIVWIISLVGIIGNVTVIYGECRVIVGVIRYGQPPSKANHILIMNLAVADLLMGVYLMMLGIAGVVFNGTFCLHKYQWLSGAPCNAMGVLVVISSENSAFTLSLLASCRTYTVVKPFTASKSPKISTVLIMIAIGWLVSITLAFIPLSSSLQYIFVEEALIPDGLFFNDSVVQLDDAKTWATKLITFDPSYSTAPSSIFDDIKRSATWVELRRILSKYGNGEQFLDISAYFGYYSAESVCIPKLFVKQDEKAWRFSLALMVANFSSFVYIASCYVVIIIFRRRTTKRRQRSMRHPQTEVENLAMQHKIFRLIVTDFCCWVPISIMAFINFSGVDVPDVAYVITAIVLLPINSALNPMLYSSFVDKIVTKLKCALSRKLNEK